MNRYIGVDIGGTKCAVVLGEILSEGEGCIRIADEARFLTSTGGSPTGVITMIIDYIKQILANNGLEAGDIVKIGISCGGPLDSKRGIIMSPPNLPGWDNIEIVNMLEKELGIKACLENDANACAVAEWKYGAGKGYDNVIFLTFGTGVGAGLILNGRLYRGANGMAGEIGHIRMEKFGPVGYGKAGSFEGFCSGSGIAQLAALKAHEKLQAGEVTAYCGSADELSGITAKNVAVAAKTGDETAALVYGISGHYLGKGLSILIDILNPEVIIIGGVFMRDSSLLTVEMMKSISDEALSISSGICKVVPAALGENIGDYGALSVAVYMDEV